MVVFYCLLFSTVKTSQVTLLETEVEVLLLTEVDLPFNPCTMLRVNLTHFSFCVDQSTGYPFFFFMTFYDFSSSRVMNWCVKSGHFDV